MKISMSSFRELRVWQEAHELTKDIYKLTDTFPVIERYRLVGQLCRAAASVSANIAEGTGRHSKKDFVKFLYVSRGSLEEARNFLILAYDLNYIKEIQYKTLDSKCVNISKMLNGLIRKLSE
jgi:four helix bundle protein